MTKRPVDQLPHKEGGEQESAIEKISETPDVAPKRDTGEDAAWQERYAELLKSGEMSQNIADRLGVYLNISPEQAVKTAVENPELFAKYKEAYEALMTADETRQRANKKYPSLHRHLRNEVIFAMGEQDCAELLASGLNPDVDRNLLENARIAALGVGSANHFIGNRKLVVDVVPDHDPGYLIEKIMSGKDVVEAMEHYVDKKSDHVKLPATLLRRDFWTMLTLLADDAHVHELFQTNPEKLTDMARHVNGWMGQELYADKGQFFIGRADAVQKKIRTLDAGVALQTAKSERKQLDQEKKREFKKQHDNLLELADINRQLKQTGEKVTELTSVVGFVARMFSADQRKNLLTAQNIQKKLSGQQEELLVGLTKQQQDLKRQGYGWHRTDKVASYSYFVTPSGADADRRKQDEFHNKFVVEYWSDVAERELEQEAEKAITRHHLETTKHKK